MEKENFKSLRKQLGKTQQEMAQVLNISVKTVESYEQGLRNIPLNIERILYYIFFKTRNPKISTSEKCWKEKNCPKDVRSNCLAWISREGFYCWFFTGKSCMRENQLSPSGNGTCFECSFFKNQLSRIE